MIYPRALKYFHQRQGVINTDYLSYQKIQKRQLAEICRHAVRNVPFYQNLGLELQMPGADQVPVWLKQFPVINKKFITDRPIEEFLAKNRPSKLSRHITSGSTGAFFQTYWDKSSEAQKISNNLAAYHFAGYRIAQRWLHLAKPMKKNKGVSAWAEKITGRQECNVSENDLTEIVDRISRFKPRVLYGHVSTLKSLAWHVRENNCDLPSPDRIITSAEILSPPDRQFLENVFRAPVFHTYGSTELGTIGVECQCHTGFHLNPYAAWVEILNEHDRPVQKGEVGRLILTGLANKTMPLIRYDIGDMGSWAVQPCACGNQNPRLMNIEGRRIDLLYGVDGARISPFAFTMALKDVLPYFREYQFTQKSLTLASFDYVPRQAISGEIILKLRKIIRKQLGPIHVTISSVNSLNRGSGKPRYIRCLVNSHPNDLATAPQSFGLKNPNSCRPNSDPLGKTRKLKLPVHGDALVRFAYCKVPLISASANRLLFWRLYASDPQRLDNQFEQAKKIWQEQKFNCTGKTILELGPGNSRLNAYNFLMNGAKKVILVDKFSRYHASRRQKQFAAQEIKYIKRKYSITELPFLDRYGRPQDNCIEFIQGDITKLNLPLVDFIYSVSVLEHIKFPGIFIKKSTDFLKPGGLMFHHIDLRDHYDFNHPFLFYKYSPEAWDRFLTREGHSFTNRWRYDDFREVFRHSRLEVIAEKKQIYSLNKVKIHNSFRQCRHLDIGIWNCLLKK